MRLSLHWHTPGVVELPDGLDRTLRFGSRLLLAVSIAVLTWEAARGNLPRDPEGDFTDDVWKPLQLALLGLTAAGLAVSFKSLAVAAAMVALGGGLLGVLSTLEYAPPFGLFVLIAFLVPAVMMWLAWQHQATMAKITVLAVSTSTLLVGTWVAGWEVYAYFNGPFHPQSDTAEPAESPVRWLWSGAVDTDGFTVKARLGDEAASVRLVVRDETGAAVATSAHVAPDDADEPVSLRVNGLEPGTDYRYVVEVDSVPDEVTSGRVRTFPDGAGSFTVAVSACAGSGSNGVVFDTIRELEPDLYLITGDMHYRNIARNDTARFRAAFDEVHRQPAQSALYRSAPVAYIWDDHDYGPNDADASSPSRPAAWASYRAHVPHYELPSGADGPIFQAFTMGRVRFVMTDTRSMKRPGEGVMLGAEQLDWLLAEFLAARDTHALTVWVSSTPWIGDANPASDQWAAFPEERARIGAFLAQHQITNLVMLAGDAHMVAIDDGSNSGYGGHDGFPVLHAAALDRRGSVKGGPYSHGTFPGAGQFGLLEVVDTGGDRIEITLRGLDYTGSELVRLDTGFDIASTVPR